MRSLQTGVDTHTHTSFRITPSNPARLICYHFLHPRVFIRFLMQRKTWHVGLSGSSNCFFHYFPLVRQGDKRTTFVRSTWLLLHTNYSDFEDAESSKAPEFFGDPVACIEPDVVGKAFKNGQEIIELQLLPAELDTPADAVQNGSLSLAMPSCSKPTEDLLFGTVSVPD